MFEDILFRFGFNFVACRLTQKMDNGPKYQPRDDTTIVRISSRVISIREEVVLVPLVQWRRHGGGGGELPSTFKRQKKNLKSSKKRV